MAPIRTACGNCSRLCQTKEMKHATGIPLTALGIIFLVGAIIGLALLSAKRSPLCTQRLFAKCMGTMGGIGALGLISTIAGMRLFPPTQYKEYFCRDVRE